MERRTKISLILCVAIISITIAIAIVLPSPPDHAEENLWLPRDAVIAKGLASSVYLSGTVINVPFETYKDLSGILHDQRVIIEFDRENIIIHYLGKDDLFTYHATQQYYDLRGIDSETIRLEGNTLKYSLTGAWLGKFLIILVGAIAAILVLVAGLKKRDC